MPHVPVFALVSAIEEDIRDVASDYLATAGKPEDLLGPVPYQHALDRHARDLGDIDHEATLTHLLPYLDLGDVIQVVNHNKSALPQDIAKYLEDRTAELN